ncbi:hypothetical protein [Pontiella sp.]|uniref:hypothetical protein n=1 Tax=Pontiella sp. TaxID=2837462 RepID=UPI00356A8B9F
MKRLVGLLIMIAAVSQADEFRTFTAEDGRTLKAKIISYDSASGKVMIEREDRKRLTVPATAFSKKDQTFIEKWQTYEAFLSPAKLKLEIERDEVDSTKKNVEVDIGDETSGGRRGGGMSGVVTVAVDKKTQYKYKLAIENKSGTALDDMTMEFRIYYDQQKPVKDEKANKGRSKDETRPEKYMAVDQLKVKKGEKKIKTLAPKQSGTISTESVVLLQRSASYEWGENIDLKSDLAGVWIKLTMRGADGELLVRDICSPESIMKKYPWDVPDEPEEPAAKAKPTEPTEDKDKDKDKEE